MARCKSTIRNSEISKRFGSDEQVPSIRDQVPSNYTQVPSIRDEVPTSRRLQLAPRIEVPSIRHEITSVIKQVPVRREQIPRGDLPLGGGD